MQNLKPCSICETTENTCLYLDVYSEHTNRDESILRCAQCSLVYVNEPLRANRSFTRDPSTKDFETAWRKQFPDLIDVYTEGSWGKTNQDSTDVVEWQYNEVLHLVGDHINLPGYTVAELGCARGHLLARVKSAHPNVHLIGIEPSPVMADIARNKGAEIINGVVEEACFDGNSIDSVIGLGSFIQMRDPLSALQSINHALCMGGRLLLDSPNNDSLSRMIICYFIRRPMLARLLGLSAVLNRANRRAYNPGRFYFYSPKSYDRLLAKCGFRITEIRMRQPRYVEYKGAGQRGRMKKVLQVVSAAEKLTNMQSWIQISAVKMRNIGVEPISKTG